MTHNLTKEQVKAFILRKLARHGYWGGRHTNIKNVHRLNGRECMEASKELVDELKKDEWLIIKPTSYGKEASLNPRFKADIEQYVQSVLGA